MQNLTLTVCSSVVFNQHFALDLAIDRYPKVKLFSSLPFLSEPL